MSPLISYAQNGEDVRVWRAFKDLEPPANPGHFTYIDVGANDPQDLSITASLHQLGWRGLLVEADPHFAQELRDHRPDDVVAEVAASERDGELTFYRVLGTGLGSLSKAEAHAGAARGFEVAEHTVQARPLTAILDTYFDARDRSVVGPREIHFLSIDVEGAEAQVLAGLDLTRYRPWVICIEAIDPETHVPNHHEWSQVLTGANYRDVAFDGINRWYVDSGRENCDHLAENIAMPLNSLDRGVFGWEQSANAQVSAAANKAYNRVAWQRAHVLNESERTGELEAHSAAIGQLTQQLQQLQSSRGYRIAQPLNRIFRKSQSVLHSATTAMPAPVRHWTTSNRHLKIVNTNLGHLTGAPFLAEPAAIGELPRRQAPAWVNPDGKPPLPSAGLTVDPLTPADCGNIENYLVEFLGDSDDSLELRTDGLADELGRVRAALRTRLRLANLEKTRLYEIEVSRGGSVLFDARSLQASQFSSRGIGRFAKAALESARASVGDSRLVLLVDPGLRELPVEIAGRCRQVARVRASDAARYSALIQPSPMTASVDPLLPLLGEPIAKIAIVYDFIPLHYPDHYLQHAATSAEYAANLDALARYTAFLPISHTVKNELARYLDVRGVTCFAATVAWPESIDTQLKAGSTNTVIAHDVTNSVPATVADDVDSHPETYVIMSGDEARKNTFGGLAAIGVATSDQPSRSVFVTGLGHRGDHVHHLSIAAAMRPGEAHALSHVSDAEVSELLQSAVLVVVPTFDEGLSLPVIEALQAGTPVVASNIAAHRELLGTGSFLANPTDLRAFAKAIKTNRNNERTARKQLASLRRHEHESVETVIARELAQVSATDSADHGDSVSSRTTAATGRPLSVGLATPWSPQKSGVAHFSTLMGIELARHVDLTVYSTSDADVAGSLPEGVRVTARNVDDLFASAGEHDHDILISVVGNSHFHLPFIALTEITDCVVIAHDTRMNEYYMALRGIGGLETLMLHTCDPGAPRTIDPPLDQQIGDMRLLQNAGMWELARRAQTFITHSPSARARHARETGVNPEVITFPNYRPPVMGAVTPDLRAQAKQRLGFSPDRIHLSTFGFIDIRTKLNDVVIEAAAWLAQWGYPISLHIAGTGAQAEIDSLTAQANHAGLTECGIPSFEITGFLSEDQLRDYLLATDIGIQLRISSLLGVSGPLSDLAGYGTPAIASDGLVRDIDAPLFVDSLPEYISPITVARALEHRILNPHDPQVTETQRIEYLNSHSPRIYVQDLLNVLTGEHAKTPETGGAV